MNQQQLQNKRRKRQAKRKVAQVTARRRGTAEKAQAAHALYEMQKGRKPMKRSLLDRFLGGGTPVTADQMDKDAAPLVGGL